MNHFRVLSVSAFDPSSPGFRRRVIRYKSRDGCQMCKAKKVKCDEAKPVCVRCRRNGRTCEYSPPQVRIHPLRLSSLSPEDERKNSRIPSMELVHHCHTQWAAIFPGFDKNVNFLAAYKSSQLVRSVCYAIAASHLRHLRPGHRPFVVSEYSYRATAMLEYKSQLESSAEDLGQEGVNTMLLSAILFNLLAFPLSPLVADSEGHNVDHTGPWIADEHDAEMGWLTFQAGLGPLMKSVAVYLPGASKFLATIFAPGPDAAMWPNVGKTPPPIPETWIEFFNLDQRNATGDMDTRFPFPPRERQPALATSVRLLVGITAYLRSLPPSLGNSVVYLAFASKAQRDFRTLLLLQNPRAWWLYGYWAGLLCRYRGDLWWCRDRAAQQYAAVKRWLNCLTFRNEEDGELWMEMLAELEAVTVFPPRDVHMTGPDTGYTRS